MDARISYPTIASHWAVLRFPASYVTCLAPMSAQTRPASELLAIASCRTLDLGVTIQRAAVGYATVSHGGRIAATLSGIRTALTGLRKSAKVPAVIR